MRPLVSWMTKSDDAILELLDECGIAIPPRAIAFNIENVSRPTIDRRLPKLEDAGLVERYDDPQGTHESPTAAALPRRVSSTPTNWSSFSAPRARSSRVYSRFRHASKCCVCGTYI